VQIGLKGLLAFKKGQCQQEWWVNCSNSSSL
jgi:hypothetical protein